MEASIEERISSWFDVGEEERRGIARLIVEQAEGGLTLVRMEGAAAVFLHRETSLLFHLVPGGRAALGFDENGLRRLREQYQYWDECDEAEFALERFLEKRRVDVSVKPFLLGAAPLSSEQLEALARGAMPGAADAKGRRLPDLERAAKMSAVQWVKFLEDFEAGTFSQGDIKGIEDALARFSLRLPSDAEREVAARAGTENLFPHGDPIPHSPNIGTNRLGLIDLGSDAEVCADGWMPSIDGLPPDGSPRPPTTGDERVARGGAASCYPWQGCAEWTLLLCASRSSSKSNDGFLVARPALSL